MLDLNVNKFVNKEHTLDLAELKGYVNEKNSIKLNDENKDKINNILLTIDEVQNYFQPYS